MIYQDILKITQQGKGTYDITDLISDIIKESKITTGTCQIFSQSGSSSVLISDTANESTKKDTADFLANLAPNDESILDKINLAMDQLPKALHNAVHRSTLSIPVTNGKPGIGVWQGIFFHKHDQSGKHKKIVITIMGE